jgi:hypothetical protein
VPCEWKKNITNDPKTDLLSIIEIMAFQNSKVSGNIIILLANLHNLITNQKETFGIQRFQVMKGEILKL